MPAAVQRQQDRAGAVDEIVDQFGLWRAEVQLRRQSARRTDKAIRAAKGLDASSSEAIIIADQTTPYRLFIEVLFTLGQSEFGKYHLMVMQGKKK